MNECVLRNDSIGTNMLILLNCMNAFEYIEFDTQK